MGVHFGMGQHRLEKTSNRAYGFGQSVLILQFGDITESKADVIVSSDDAYISMGGGVSASILRAGGQEIIIDAAKRRLHMSGTSS
jgi:O-acetyl-ADP-ribose deacetylase (regulator of RNase III)